MKYILALLLLTLSFTAHAQTTGQVVGTLKTTGTSDALTIYGQWHWTGYGNPPFQLMISEQVHYASGPPNQTYLIYMWEGPGTTNGSIGLGIGWWENALPVTVNWSGLQHLGVTLTYTFSLFSFADGTLLDKDVIVHIIP